ncbi:MAG: oligosaccharide flippase family protein, partial [Tannerella sp.]|nr:oligosaccharide flippase family protein [Tannerella sp.]
MIKAYRDKILAFFNKGHERTVLTKKNIAVSFVIKGITILISTIMIPLTINYANPERNGLWVVLYSMVVWLNLFDIGFGNGMKNRLAEAKAAGNNELCRKYISSTYVIMGLICTCIFVVFCFINPNLNWSSILKNDITAYDAEIAGLIWIFMASFCLTFVLNLVKFVVIADQRPAIAAFIDMLGQLLTFAGIFILSKTTSPSLIYLGLVSGFAPVIVYLIANIYLFTTRYKMWRPSFRFVNFRLAGNMMNLGIKFFITTCAAFMTTQTLNFLIQRFVNSAEVTTFNTAQRLFSILFNVMGIIILPYWSAFTDA